MKTAKHKPTGLSFYDKLVKYFERAQRRHPLSHVAFHPGTGKVLVHRKDRKKFSAELRDLMSRNPGIMPGIILGPKSKTKFVAFFRDFSLQRALSIGRMHARINGA